MRRDEADTVTVTSLPRPKPCNNCRERHIKCERDVPVCSQCRTDGVPCVRSQPKARFKTGSSANYDTEFPKDQTWISTKRQKAAVRIVDETDNVRLSYSNEDVLQPGEDVTDHSLFPTTLPLEAFQPHGHDRGIVHHNKSATFPSPSSAQRNGSGLKYDEREPNAVAVPHSGQYFPEPALPAFSTASSITSPLKTARSTPASRDLDLPPSKRARPNSFAASSAHSGSPPLTRTPQLKSSPFPYRLSDVIRPADPWDDTVNNIIEAMLLRYFIESLSRWFDLNDPTKYFRITVPQRARTCRPLMNAVLTASARHMTRVKSYRGPNGVVRYDDRDLPGLTTETALNYHNECIKDLINYSTNSNTMGTEDFLAAAIILRFYEEVDAPLRDEEKDSELFRQMAMAFFKTRPDVSSPDVPMTSPVATTHSAAGEIFGHSPTLSTPAANNQTPRSTYSEQLTSSTSRPNQAPYWVALRQEIHHSFVNQRAFLIPLPKAPIYRSFDSVSDEIWSKRLVVFCADVIEYSYGTNNANDPRWFELKQREEKFGTTLPPTFAPIYYAEPDRTLGQVFPVILYIDDWHTIGVQHMELARILLAVSNPARPKLGRGHLASTKAMNEELKTIALRLCGIALGASKMPPSLVTAYTGICTCGELFEEELEQQAIMSFLEELEEVHAWPIGEAKTALADAWGWPEP